MLAADPDLDVRTRLASAYHADLHQFADAVRVDGDKGINLQDALGDVSAEKSGGIITADPVRGLRQVVSAERKELRGFGDVPGHQASARQFDHGTDLVA